MRRVFAILTAGLLFLPLTSSALFAQQTKDPQSSFEPRAGAGVGQKYLQQMTGEWDVTKVFHPREGAAVQSAGTCRQTMVQDGKFLQSDFVFKHGDRTTTGQGVIGFESEAGRFTSFWVDSRQTRMSARQSREPFDGKQIVLYSLSLDPQARETRRTKTVSTVEDGGRKLVHRQYILGSGGEERLIMELLMTRKP